MKPQTFMDLPINDIFGHNVTIIKYPQRPAFNNYYYTGEIKKVVSFINYEKPNIYIFLKQQEINCNKILPKFLHLIKKYKGKTINIFLEYVLYRNFLSYLPKIWYNGNMYIELIQKNLIYGYIKVIYVNRSFIIHKKYKDYNTILI